MTTFNASAVSDLVIAHRKRILLQTMRALRDHPIAMLEGAPTAPLDHHSWHPYDGVAVGDGATGLIYDFAVNGAVASVETPNFADGYEYLVLAEGISSAAPVSWWRIEGYRQTAASWGAVNLSNFDVASPGGPTPSPAVNFFSRTKVISPRRVAGAHMLGSDYLAHPADDRISRVRMSFNAGNISAGKIYVCRRRCLL